MPRASDLKRNQVIEVDGLPMMVLQVETQSPSARSATTLYKTTLRNVQNGQRLQKNFKGDDFLPDVDAVRKEMQFSYRDGDQLVFMALDDYAQYPMPEEALGDDAAWLYEGMEGLIGMLIDEQLVALELPQQVEATVVDTQPSIKGATATKSHKPAMLDNGVEVGVPDYIETGERIRVNTQTRKFVSRA